MNERRRTLLFSGGYKIPTENGIYIESVDHEFYLPDDWDSANTANSIAVVTDAHKFRIALTYISSYMRMGSAYDPWETKLSGTTNSGTTDGGVASTDYNGVTNTQLIVEKCQSSTAYAAGACNAYTFPDGVTKGYLPALGELYLIYPNKAAIDAALAKCGGTLFGISENGYHWSSTFYGLNGNFRYCWVIRWSDGGVYHNYLDGFMYVRAFAPL